MGYDVTVEYDRVEVSEQRDEWARDFNALLNFTPHPQCRLTRYRSAVLLRWYVDLTERVPEWKAFRKATSETYSWQMAHEAYTTAKALLDAIMVILIDRELIPAKKGKAA